MEDIPPAPREIEDVCDTVFKLLGVLKFKSSLIKAGERLPCVCVW